MYESDGDVVMLEDETGTGRCRHIRVVFDPGKRKKHVLDLLSEKSTIGILGCVAWLSDRDIIRALSQHKCSLICSPNLGKMTHQPDTSVIRTPYDPRYPPITLINSKPCLKHGYHILMHNKFIIGLSSHGIPMWVITGSMNFTNHAFCNFENLIKITEKSICYLFLREYHRIRRAVSNES